jgi:hypothetical protein
MDMYSKMDGSTSVSQVLGGVWKIQKKSGADDQRDESKKKNKEKQEEEKDFEDGRVLNDHEMTMEADILINDGITETGSKEDYPSPKRKIDIVI